MIIHLKLILIFLISFVVNEKNFPRKTFLASTRKKEQTKKSLRKSFDQELFQEPKDLEEKNKIMDWRKPFLWLNHHDLFSQP